MKQLMRNSVFMILYVSHVKAFKKISDEFMF